MSNLETFTDTYTFKLFQKKLFKKSTKYERRKKRLIREFIKQSVSIYKQKS